MRIEQADLQIHRQPFARPFAFKGASFREKWILIAKLQDASGVEAVGIGGTAVLWSDSSVFSAHTEVGGNLLSASVLEFALQESLNRDFTDPFHLQNEILAPAHSYAQQITRNPDLRLSFTLISLVALDNAAWMLHAKLKQIDNFDDLIPHAYRDSLSEKQTQIALAPAVGYNLPVNQIQSILERGDYILKIKLGQPGTQSEMVDKDLARLRQIHELARGYQTTGTQSGNVLYYLDANARYEKKQSVEALLDGCAKSGIHDRIILLEEPFVDPRDQDVSDLSVRVAADESLERVKDLTTRREQGYEAMVIKPAGKTLTLAFQMAKASTESEIPCFVADNACVPFLLEWNKNVGARLPPFPGLKGGLIESNGPENYGNWPELLDEFPIPNAPWLKPKQGSFLLDDEYYQQSGGIFEEPVPYSRLFD
jgi:hypothetical protein